MQQEDENSSEGIVVSSDDEMFDGLSQAVEHHIFEQEVQARYPSAEYGRTVYAARGFYPSRKQHWRHGPPSEAMHSGAYYSYENEQPWRRGSLLYIDQDKPAPHAFHSPLHEPYSCNKIFSRASYDRSYRHSGLATPHTEYLSTPRTEIMQQRFNPQTPHRPNPANIRREFSPPAVVSALKESEYSVYSNQSKDNTPRSSNANSSNVLALPGGVAIDSQPKSSNYHMTKGDKKETDQGQTRRSLLESQNGKMGKADNKLDLFNPEDKGGKLGCNITTAPSRQLPKPINFKIKAMSVPPPLSKRHPPFSSPVSGESDPQSSDPSHSRLVPTVTGESIEAENEQNNTEYRKRSENDSMITPESSKKKKESRKREDSKEQTSADSKKHKKKSKFKAGTEEKLKSSHKEDDEIIEPAVSPSTVEDSNPVKNEKENVADTVYEEEVIEELEREDSLTESALVGYDINDEEDEEMLQLRRDAIASALNKAEEDEHELSSQKSRQKGKSRKSDPLLRQMVKSKKNSAKKLSKKRRRKSNVAGIFLKKYSDIARHQSPEKISNKKTLRRKSKPSAMNLTLFGEIMKNSKKSKTEALRYIRSLPDGSKGTEMFLKLMKSDNDIEGKSSAPQKLKNNDENLEDNYEEIEMELDLEEVNEEDLVPPGTSDVPIAVPKESNGLYDKRNSTDKKDKIEGSVCSLNNSSCKNHDSSLIPATPSQESIWSMLEQPIRQDAALPDSSPQNESNAHVEGGFGIDKEANPHDVSEEPDIDDETLNKLRNALLHQISKKSAASAETNIGQTVPPETEVGNQTPVMKSDGQQVVILPSQYPYQPPTLQVAKTRATKQDDIQSSNISSKTTFAVPTATISSTHEVTDSPVICLSQPQMTSTPVSSIAPCQPKPTVVRRRQRKRKRSKKQNTTLEASVGKVDSSSIQGKAEILETNQANDMAKTPIGAVPEVAITPDVIPATAVPKPVMAPMLASQTPTSGRQVELYTSSSQVVFKTATTLIKTNNKATKRPVTSNAANSNNQHKVRVLDKPLAAPGPMHLPRHQPVVINLNTSSDEEVAGTSTSSKSRVPPVAFPHSTLDSLIEQVRQQTSIEQSGKRQNVEEDMAIASQNAFKLQKPEEKLSQNDLSWPFTVASEDLPKARQPHHVKLKRRSSDKPKLKTALARSSANKLSEGIKAPDRQVDSSVEIKQVLEETKEKFLKLKAFISKDEILYKRILKIKGVKQAELKVVQDELKEMIHRVAAIKGKASRCEEIVARYRVQEAKMKERLEKKNKLKLKLKEQIKRQLLKARSQQRRLKNNQNQQKKSKTPATASAKDRNQEKLELEKRRLLVVEQQLAAKISRMKKADETSVGTKTKRRVSLSKEVQSHLEKYNKSKKASNPSTHDLSLNKIAISSLSPARDTQKSHVHHGSPNHNMASPLQLGSPVKTPQQPSLSGQKTTIAAPSSSTTTSPKPGARIEVDVRKPDVEDALSKSSTKRDGNSNNKGRLWIQQEFLKSINNMKPLMIQLQQYPVANKLYNKSWHKATPDCFKNWKVDVGDVLQITGNCSEKRVIEFDAYVSPLRQFRSHRLSPFLRTKEKIMIKSRTFSHKIDPERMLCRYDLTGTCNDPQCQAQHSSDYELTQSELVFDLISYCPALLGENASMGMKYEDLLELADLTYKKFCGVGSSKQTAISTDEMAILIASKVKTALGYKAPFTTIFKPRTIRPKQMPRSSTLGSIFQQEQGAELNETDKGYMNVSDDVVNTKQIAEHQDFFVREERYFIEKDTKSLLRIEEALKRNPHDIQLWLQLACRKMQVGSTDTRNSLELGLHTMCLALEENPYVGELWGQYLDLLKHRKVEQSDGVLEEMVSKAVELVPLSRHVWNQLFSWEQSCVNLEILYEQLISNLMKNADENVGEESCTGLDEVIASRWLLEIVLQRTQLHMMSRGVQYAIPVLEATVKDFSQQCRSTSSGAHGCLTQKDLCNLWLAYINLKYFRTLPQSVLSNSSAVKSSKHCLGVIVIPDTDVSLQIEPNKKMDEVVYSCLHTDLNISVKECACAVGPTCTACLTLFWERLRLEIGQQLWDCAISTCQILQKNINEAITSSYFNSWGEDSLHQRLTEVEIVRADLLVRKGDTFEATQVFDDAVTNRPWDACLCHEAALFQLNQRAEDVDVDAALLYFETCARAYLKLDEDTLTCDELLDLFHYLLRLPAPFNKKYPPFNPGVKWEKVHKNKTYIWLIYCILLEMCEEPVNVIFQAYENAIVDISEDKNRQHVWLRYLSYRQSQVPADDLASKTELLKARKTWLRSFTAVVRRCILTCPAQFLADGVTTAAKYYTDYSFHNQVATIFLSCFHTRQQTSAAYSLLVDLTPHNVPLLLRACQHFLSFGDHASVISILWKATNGTCQSEMLWKISILAHYTRGKKLKAIRLCRQAVEALPYSCELWSDYLTLLSIHGKVEDLKAEKYRCSSCLQIDPNSLIPGQPS